MRPILLPLLILSAAFAPRLDAQFAKSAAANLELSDGAGAEVQVKLAATADAVYASWYDSDPAGSPAFGYDVRLQRLDAAGNQAWPAGGVLVADRGFSSTQDYGLAVDAGGDAYLAFRDDRQSGTQITAARIDAAGQAVWGATGVQITSTTDFVAAPKIAVTTTGTVFVAWTQSSTLRLRRLDGAGAFQGSEIVLSLGGGSLFLADLGSTPNDTVVVSWISQVGGFFGPRHLYAQSFSSTGTELWTPGGVPLETTNSLQIGNFPALTVDAAGGAYFAWYGVGPLECYVQHVLANGTTAYGPAPVAVSTDVTRVRVGPSLAIEPSSGLPIVFWTEQNGTQSQAGLRAQRFDATGARLFGPEGLDLVPLSANTVRSITAVATAGGARGLWIGGPSFANDQVSSVLVGNAGTVLQPPSVLASTPSEKDDLAGTPGPLGDVIAAWHGTESGDQGVHAQNVTVAGALGPQAGVLPRTGAGNQEAYSASGGALGTLVSMEVDLGSSGYPFALVLGYLHAASIPFAGQTILADITSAEVLHLAVQAGAPLATFSALVPNDPSLCGTVVRTQGVMLSPGQPFLLTNARDIYLGVD
ncbi:MAG: hypothetical protein WD226_10080 [Planctomycetota bacterium]